MFIYGTYPVVSTEIVFEALKKHSDDPLVQIGVIALDPETNTVVAYGVNKIINFLSHNAAAEREMAIDKNPVKKFLVRHAEIDLLEKIKEHRDLSRYEFIVNVQPCMACLSSLLDKRITNIKYIKENRHQDEQEMIKPFLKNINYGKIEHKMVCIPPWLLTEAELEEVIRNNRAM